MAKAKVMTVETTDRQKKYVADQKAKGQGLGIVFADAFLRGMRDLGYKNPAWALAEQLDNSFQAGADTVALRFMLESGNKSRARVEQLALVDNGNGMIPEMIGYAVRWGGTDREGDRNGFGRYGYGLPSSAVSLAKRYTVYSKVSGGEWHAVTVDIGDLADAANDPKRTEDLLTARPAALPEWVLKAAGGGDTLDLVTLDSGTVVVFEDLDRLSKLNGWKEAERGLKTKLLQLFGVIYRHFIPQRRIVVDGVTAQAVDPLFLMEHGRFFDETPVRAEKVESRTFEVQTPRGTTGTVTIRAAYLPPHFQLEDPSLYGAPSKKPRNNKRFEVMRDFNGLLICREQRQIDCIQPPFTKFQVYDRNVKVEIDFDPELDEYFGITTAKQQIVIDDEMWEKLQHAGAGGGNLINLIKSIRKKFTEEGTALEAKAQCKAIEEALPLSVEAMELTEALKDTVLELTQAQKEEGSRNLEALAAQQAAATGQPVEKVVEELREQATKRRWKVDFASIPEGPFYRPVRLGEQKQLVVNTDHPFYAKVYQKAPAISHALQVLLMVLAERELEARGEAETFYKAERQRWSQRLRHALDALVSDESMVNLASAMAEQLHLEVEAE